MCRAGKSSECGLKCPLQNEGVFVTAGREPVGGMQSPKSEWCELANLKVEDFGAEVFD